MNIDEYVKKQKNAIVGSGPGGLTLARLLQKAGMDVWVYDRDEREYGRLKGATPDLHEDAGLRVLLGRHFL